MSSYAFSTRAVIAVAVSAIVLPLVIRLISSPIALILVSPILALFALLSFFVGHIVLAQFLDSKRKPSHGLRNSARPFAFSTPAAWQAVITRSQWSHNPPQSLPPLLPDSPVVSDALNEILIMIVRDFVLTWYTQISASPSFPTAVSGVLHDSIERLLERASTIDLSALVVKRILPKVTAHIEQFRQSEVALRGARLERQLTQSEELDLLLASRYAANGKGAGGKLHAAIENLSTTFTKQTEETHLRKLVERALPFVLPPPEANSLAVKIVVREIVACSVMGPVMEMVSDPDFWNRVIDQVAGAAIHQQKLITKVRNVLEAQSPRPQSRLSTAPTPSSTEQITIRTDVRQFESFLRSISRFSSLLDARRLKNDIVGEIRRTRILLANHEKDDWINGEKTEDVVAFLDRLYTAKRKVDERIVVLGGADDSVSRYSTVPDTTPKSGLRLRDILQNPSSLSYLMEFMDRRHRSLPVQFWLTVESFKNPLESVDSGSSGDDDETMQDPSSATTAKEDICMINDLYFSGPSLHPTLSTIPRKHIEAIRSFANTNDQLMLSPRIQRKARRSVMLAQRHMERDMEQDFEEFQRSELWFRAIGDTEFGGGRKQPLAESISTPLEAQTKKPLGSMGDLLSRSESLPVFTMQRSISAISSLSAHSNSSGSLQHMPRAAPSDIQALMSPISDTSDSSRAPLFDDPPDEEVQEADAQSQRMEAIQAALTDIIAEQDPIPGHGRERSITSLPSMRRLDSSSKKRRAMFDDDHSIDEIEEDPAGEPGDQDVETAGGFQLAAPGDLQLSYEIARLGDNINKLLSQDAMLDTLIKKAELTGDTQELRLLTKSKSSMNREIRELKFQKLQYEQQESANRLVSDRTKVAIVSSTVGDEEGKSVVRYLIEVQQLATDGSFASGWVVARRYNEFLSMHTKLRERYVLVRGLDFPGKRLVAALSGSFVDTRRVALERYLQNVIAIPIVCESDELRAFLSRESPFMAAQPLPAAIKPLPGFSGSDLVRTVYRSVTESIDDMFFGPSMLDVMIQRLTRQAAEFAGIVGTGVTDEDLVAHALNASGKAVPDVMLPRDLKPLEGETSTSTFSAPICDLVLAIFELNKKNNWLRRQAIVIILQQVLGGTIERKIRENVKGLLDDSRLLSYIKTFRDGLWPGGKLKPPSVPRTAEEKLRTRDEANRKLSSVVPDLAANMIGRSNARRGARRIFAVLQNRRLNQHIAYTVVDEVFNALFPEANTNSPPIS